MTAEVAIANSAAVALAADSAVTIGDQKIYNSALKLFALSKVAPVGVMVYGNAGLLNVPWETLIKTFRKKLAKTTFPTLEEYAQEFINYLNDNSNFFPEEVQLQWLKSNVEAYFEVIRDELFDKIHPNFQEKGEIDNKTINSIFTNIVSKHHSELKAEKYAETMGQELFNIILKEYADVFSEIRKKVFEKIKVSRTIETKLNEIAAYLHVKQKFSNILSGIVVAGYGESEIYPSVLSYDIEGVIKNRLKYRKNQEKSGKISNERPCQIIAFAQEDMVSTFMQGINPFALSFLQSYLSQLFERIPDLLHETSLNNQEKDTFKSKSSKLLSVFFEQLKEHIRENHAFPVLRMVTVLPKDELAAMAEALVNLTAFKRRMTESMETVGGPIDVAVISKGDGLVWVKRKHYFPPELNQHFFANYFRDISNG